ncbi:MAG: sodium:solute symporter family transporter [Cypionkella sp.]
MSVTANTIWLPLYGLFYTAVVLYWARIAARENRNTETYFSAGHSLSPWVAALTLAGASLSGWFVLGGTADIAANGFSLPGMLEAGIALALPGVLFFKRMWFVAQRLRLSSQAELFRSYYESDFLVVVSALIAVLFAVGFAGLQMRALSQIIAALTVGTVSALVAGMVLGVVLFGYVVIGGMRAVGYLGAMQSLLMAAAMAGLAGYALIATGGFAVLNAGLALLAATPGSEGLFLVSGVINFSAGLGRDAVDPPITTAVASLSLAMAFMGFQASPLAAKIVLSTRNANGFAAGQTWVTAGAFGGLIVFGTAIIGAAGLLDARLSVPGMLALLQDRSPWFMAWIFIGLVAGVQMLAGLALLTAGESLVRNVYKPYFHSNLSRGDTVNLTRVVIGLLALISVLMQSLTPVTLSALAAVALPLSFQLWTPLLGITWLRWITRPAAVTGVGFGIAGVLLTEPLGYQILSYLGLELPWGRWPWTIQSAAWGMAANLAAVLIISAITNREAFGEQAQEARRFLHGTLRVSARARALNATAWSVILAWLFLAIGPGLIFGNFAFGTVNATGGAWSVGTPSIWAWAVIFWAVGVGVVWFLSYKMEMASPYTLEIPAYEPRPRLRRDQSVTERERLWALVITGAAMFALIVLTVLSFGG